LGSILKFLEDIDVVLERDSLKPLIGGWSEGN
jgi:hypothetical protein